MKQRAHDKRSARRRKDQTYIVIIISVVAVVIAGILILLNLPAGESDVPVKSFDDIPQNVITEGGFGISIGQLDAPATLIEYSDFSCPHCRDVAPSIEVLIERYVKDGRLRIIYKPIAFVNPQYSTSAARAVICAAQQEKGWEMNNQIWGIFSATSPAAYTPSRLAASARSLDLNLNDFNACFGAATTGQFIQDVETEADRLGINSTPTFVFNGTQLPPVDGSGLLATIAQVLDSQATEIETP
jgi:protein-disulfide isomerase